MHRQFGYRRILSASEKVECCVDEIIGGDKTFDFTKPFLPESQARVNALTFMTPSEQLALNQIRGHSYLYIFGLVQEFILPSVLDHVRSRLNGDAHRLRAFLQFAGGEAKHIQLFKRFRQEFEDGFGSTCEVIGPPDEIAKAVLSHHPLGAALAILHIGWMSQRHYLDSVEDGQDLDPLFKCLLQHHWMEEAQHAKRDTPMVEAIADGCSASEIEQGVAAYAEIGGLIDRGLAQQVAFDLDSFERATGRTLSHGELKDFTDVQEQATRWTFLGSGMTHPNFLLALERVSPAARAEVEKTASAFC